jgi:hypothetical protein
MISLLTERLSNTKFLRKKLFNTYPWKYSTTYKSLPLHITLYPFSSTILYLHMPSGWKFISIDLMASHVSGYSHADLKNFLMHVVRVNKLLNRTGFRGFEEEAKRMSKNKQVEKDENEVLRKVIGEIREVVDEGKELKEVLLEFYLNSGFGESFIWTNR